MTIAATRQHKLGWHVVMALVHDWSDRWLNTAEATDAGGCWSMRPPCCASTAV